MEGIRELEFQIIHEKDPTDNKNAVTPNIWRWRNDTDCDFRTVTVTTDRLNACLMHRTRKSLEDISSYFIIKHILHAWMIWG